MDHTNPLGTLLDNPVIASLKNKPASVNSMVSTILDWAYTQTLNDDLPLGLANSPRLAAEYTASDTPPAAACANLVKHELPKLSGIGLLTSFGGLTTLPVNVAAVYFLQLRLVNAIAVISGRDLQDEPVKQLALLSMLGAQATTLLKNPLLRKGTDNLLHAIAPKLAAKLSSRLGGKFIPILGGIIGTSLDTLATYAIVKAAQDAFAIEPPRHDAFLHMQEQRVRLLVNMARADGNLDENEKNLILGLIAETSLPDPDK